MRTLRKAAFAAATAAAAVGITFAATGTALADPPPGVTPQPGDVVGAGSDTTQNLLDQLSHDYNMTHAGVPQLYSWDATGSSPITTKSDCASIPRSEVNGSSAGIAELEKNAKGASGEFCIDFARSSRPRQGDPTSVDFIALAQDAVTWSTQSTSNAPASLTQGQLKSIYQCNTTDWGAVGGTAGQTIQPWLPQGGSGTRAFFEQAIGLNDSTLGSCVQSGPEENEATDPRLQDPNVLIPYSIGKYIAETDHSDALNADGSCTPSGDKNLFGCDTHGNQVLKQISGIDPKQGTPPNETISDTFLSDPTTQDFGRIVSDVVRTDNTTADLIPAGPLENIFGAGGYVCTDSQAQADIADYGFDATPFCGSGDI